MARKPSPCYSSVPIILLFLSATAASAQAGSDPAPRMRHLSNMRIPMRDSVTLAADVYLPASQGRFPIVLARTPYGRHDGPAKDAARYVRRGYVFVSQDVRGTGQSGGTFGLLGFYGAEQPDGYDTIEWLARQPWSNGKIGMVGGSYLGGVQVQAARMKPPHLACLVAQAIPIWQSAPYQDGAWTMEWNLSWGAERLRTDTTAAGQFHRPADSIAAHIVHQRRPLLTMDSVYTGGLIIPWYRFWLEHPTDAYWKHESLDETDYPYGELNIPTLVVTGWFDDQEAGSLEYWRNMRKDSPARDRVYLLVGAWAHGEAASIGGRSPHIGQLNRTAASELDVTALAIRWFDFCLKDTTAHFDFPRARVFVTGENVWKDLDDLPPSTATMRSLYLHSGGRANTLTGDGRLSWDQPANTEAPDHYFYDPKKPVPQDGFEYGKDQRTIEQRPDVLVYTSDVLKQPVKVLGPVSLVLNAATDALDTDWIVNISDVYPDGSALRLAPGYAGGGIIRARYRKGFHKEVLLTPNQPEEYQIKLYDIGATFLAGHRIRIDLTSSAYPTLSPNQNTGNPVATDTIWKTANQSVFHDRDHPTRLLLSIVPTADAAPHSASR